MDQQSRMYYLRISKARRARRQVVSVAIAALLLVAMSVGVLACNSHTSVLKVTGIPLLVPATTGSTAGIDDTRTLELVNREFATGAAPESSLIVPAISQVQVLTADVTLDSRALAAVSSLFAAAGAEGFDRLYVSSGFRSYAEQRDIYNEARGASYVSPPGFSEHETGLAVDIMVEGVDQYLLGHSREGQWLQENSWRFGLILRYPEEKPSITGIAYEPWHFRYVGLVHAYYCYANDLCLEEYISLLKDRGGYGINLNGIDYSVLYVWSPDDIDELVEGVPHEVSGDNTGGYIVTTWVA